MSALIKHHLPLIRMSGAHKMTARGYRAIWRGYSAPGSGAGSGRLQAEAAKREAAIAANLKGLGYGG